MRASSLSSILRSSLVMVLVAGLSGGCVEPSEVTDVITAPRVIPSSGSLDGLSIVVPQGRTLAFIAQPMNGEETLKQDITLEPVDASIAQVFSLEDMNHFAVVGEDIGQTTLDVLDKNGQLTEPSFSVEVVAP